MALQPLLARRADVHWALDHVAGFLSALDATQLLVAALESGRRELQLGLAAWLLRGAAPLPPVRATRALQEAARAECWKAVRWLAREVVCAETRGGEPVPTTPSYVVLRNVQSLAMSQGRCEVVQWLHEVCGVPRTPQTLLKPCIDPETLAYALNNVHATPAELENWVDDVAAEASLEAITFLVKDRGLWSRTAFEAAVICSCVSNRGHHWTNPDAEVVEPAGRLRVAQFLIAHARARAETLCTPLEAQVRLDKISILHVANVSERYALAQWLVECVPEVDSGPGRLRDGNAHAPNHERASKATGVVLACLRCRPAQCRDIMWMPRWAVVANCEQAFAKLVEMDHPALASEALHRAVVEHSRDSRFIDLIFTRFSAEMLIRDVAGWAASFGICSVLKRVYSQQDHLVEARLEMLRLAATRSATSGHLEILDWVYATCEAKALSKEAVFCDCAFECARFGHVDALQWLQGHAVLLLEDAEKTSRVLNEVVRFRQVTCLHWLLKNADVPADAAGVLLLDAVQQGNTVVVVALTDSFAPSDLPLPRAQIALVRRFMYKHGMLRQENPSPFGRFLANAGR